MPTTGHLNKGRSLRSLSKTLIGKILAVTIAAGAVLATASPAAAIVGGTLVPAGRYQAAASLQLPYHGVADFHFCGGTVIAARWVVTNAHCVTDEQLTTIPTEPLHARVGSTDRHTGGELVGVDKVLPHASWDWAGGTNPIADIALLHLASPVHVPPMRLFGPIDPRGLVTLLGWGYTTMPSSGPAPADLSQIDARRVDPGRCAAVGITAGEICFTGVRQHTAACLGDSGSPAVEANQLLGGASRGTDEVTCDGGYAAYTDIRHYRWWILQVMRTGTVPPPLPGQEPTPPPQTLTSPQTNGAHWPQPIWAD
jgi:secreted trypsin-like serine protease